MTIDVDAPKTYGNMAQILLLSKDIIVKRWEIFQIKSVKTNMSLLLDA